VRLIHTHLDQSKRHPAHRHVDDQQIQATRHRRQVHLHVHDTRHLRIFLLPASAYETGTIVVEAATGAGATPWCRASAQSERSLSLKAGGWSMLVMAVSDAADKARQEFILK